LWDEDRGPDARVARKRITTLSQKALLTVEGVPPNRGVFLHDLQHDYLRATAKDLVGLHKDLIELYRRRSPEGGHAGPDDGYYLGHLSYHLAEAKMWDELAAVLLDQRFIRAKLDTPLGRGRLGDDFRWAAECLAVIPTPQERQLFNRLAHAATAHSFLNRAHELEEIEGAIRGDGHLHTVLGGPPGIGKSSLVNYVWLRQFRECILVRPREFRGEFLDCLTREILSVSSVDPGAGAPG